MLSRRFGAVRLITALAVCAVAGSVKGQGDEIAQGRLVAARACAACHAVAPDQASVNADGIPALPFVMRRTEVDAPWLRNFLRVPHRRMPQVALVRDEQEALIAYLLSLKKP